MWACKKPGPPTAQHLGMIIWNFHSLVYSSGQLRVCSGLGVFERKVEVEARNTFVTISPAAVSGVDVYS